MAGVWPRMERRRLACGAHLGKLVVDVGHQEWALGPLWPELSPQGRTEQDSLGRLGSWVGAQGPDGGREGRVSGRKDKFPPTPQQRSWVRGLCEGLGEPGVCSQPRRGNGA